MLARMPSDAAPPDIVALADARSTARRARDWATADRLRGEIEAAGWRVIDAASLYSLERAVAPDVVEDGRTRYGSSGAVPSRLEDEPVGFATVVLAATDEPDELARRLRSLVDHAPDGVQVVVVANAPAPAQAAALDALDALDPGAPGILTEVVWTSQRLGHAAALNAGIRRSGASIVILLGAGVEVAGDFVTPLVEALEDPAVAVAGPYGLVSADLRLFSEAAGRRADVTAITGDALAFRRADYAEHGPLDEHFQSRELLDVWWTLVLRDVEGGPPRRAVRVPDLPVVRHERHDARDTTADPGAERAAKKNRYRVLKRFATRRDLAVPGT